MHAQELDTWHMARALELAQRGRGRVEPNPLVGALVVRGAEIIGEGWHRRFGGAHAEIEALEMAGPRAAGATLVCTLEPCCHHGKTPPCTAAIIAAGISRVVIGMQDPFAEVAGRGIAALENAGIETVVGVCREEAASLNAPYLKLIGRGRPWVIAKWAMSLDGKLATRAGDSRWISGPESRQAAHALRGRVDAVIVGRGTLVADDPLLTARPPGPRVAARIVLASAGDVPHDCQLLRTLDAAPVVVAVRADAPQARRRRLADAGCDVVTCTGSTYAERFTSLLDQLGRRSMTNVLVEGGARVLGTLVDAGEIDEVHVFIAPKVIGGEQATIAVGGGGIERLADALPIAALRVERTGHDVYVSGHVARD